MNEQHLQLVKGSLPQKRQTPASSLRIEYSERDIETLYAERITDETVLPPMTPLFKIEGSPCFYRGELVADCGKAKSGKTTFLSVLMTAGIVGRCLCIERAIAKEGDQTTPPCGHRRLLHEDAIAYSGGERLRVLWIDTEQSQQSTQEIIRERIMPMMQEQDGKECTDLSSYLYAFNLRGMGYELRRRMVSVAVQTVKPDLCIIDGIKDLMTNINDADQATMIMEQLMDLAKAVNCSIVCVLHQNKSESDRNMRGSIGTELTNKAFEVYQCEFLERREMFKVTQTLSRKKRIKEAIGYRLNEKGLPESCELPPEQPRDDNGRWTKAESDLDSEELKALFNKAMEGRTQRPFNEVMAVALKKCNVPDVTTYYKYLKEAEELGIINKMTASDTNKQWIELTDEGMLPF